mmetsp:Transcript_3638/g.5369  ORF Transcript_3638/g.5369 Transcript_3638/m.5369 type:complete len:91 (-) Transcript_3638:2388-2660(-)
MIECSVSASKADVASSSKRTDGFLYNARAMHTRWSWPPLIPASASPPITVSYLSGRRSMTSAISAARAAFSTAPGTSGCPNRMLSRIVPW